MASDCFQSAGTNLALEGLRGVLSNKNSVLARYVEQKAVAVSATEVSLV